MRRVAAAWRLRSREHGHLLPVLVTLALILVTVGGGSMTPAPRAALLLAALGWVAVWVWGLWDEGGRLVDRKYGSRLRRR